MKIETGIDEVSAESYLRPPSSRGSSRGRLPSRSDLPGQRVVSKLTRRLVAALLRPPWLRTDPLLAHARLFFEDVVRPEQILTWGGAFASVVAAGEPVSLSKHLDFAEQIYLPSVLDRCLHGRSRRA